MPRPKPANKPNLTYWSDDKDLTEFVKDLNKDLPEIVPVTGEKLLTLLNLIVFHVRNYYDSLEASTYISKAGSCLARLKSLERAAKQSLKSEAKSKLAEEWLADGRVQRLICLTVSFGKDAIASSETVNNDLPRRQPPKNIPLLLEGIKRAKRVLKVKKGRPTETLLHDLVILIGHSLKSVGIEVSSYDPAKYSRPEKQSRGGGIFAEVIDLVFSLLKINVTVYDYILIASKRLNNSDV